jgi:hypothetical protein
LEHCFYFRISGATRRNGPGTHLKFTEARSGIHRSKVESVEWKRIEA